MASLHSDFLPDATGPIDAVVTWVDGTDPAHRRKRERVLKQGEYIPEQQRTLPTGTHTTRFQHSGELFYCLQSIRTFAPWIRRIYLVTDNQRPDFLDTHPELCENLHLVDHTAIFEGYEWALPTFNSRTIETALWRIPGLASRFIYFNDDFVLTSATHLTDFFRDEGVVLRGTWGQISRFGPVRMWLNDVATVFAKRALGITRSMNHLLQMRSARLAGFNDRYFDVPHVPHPLRRDVLQRFFASNEELFEENIQHRFRSTDQFSAVYLAHHLEIARGQADTQDPDRATMINGEMRIPFVLQRTLRRIAAGDYTFVCLQGFENFSDEAQATIKAVLDARMAASTDDDQPTTTGRQNMSR